MKKIVQIGVATAFIGASLFGGIVSAQADRGDIRLSRTGPDSRNEIRVSDKIVVDCQNNNEVTFNNISEMQSQTGTAIVEENTGAGSAQTGDVLNINETQLNIAIDNTCDVPVEEETEKPGQGAGPVKPVDTDNDDKPTTMTPEEINGRGSYSALPYTEGASPIAIAALATAAAGVVVLGARLGASAYARFKS